LSLRRKSIRVTAGHVGQIGRYLVVSVLVSLVTITSVRAQGQEPASAVASLGSVQGHVRDASGRPLANATVSLHLPGVSPATLGIPWVPIQITHTDSAGAYQLSRIVEGDYILFGGMVDKPALGNWVRVRIARNETATVDIALPARVTDDPRIAVPAKPTSKKPVVSAPEFFDEPQFTVAGITQATSSGGHGSDIAARTTESLAKATITLGKEQDGTSSSNGASAASESDLRDAVARDPEDVQANRQLGKLLFETGKPADAVPYLERASHLRPGDPDLHHLLAEVDEKAGNPLEAVREYQNAAELDPSEPNLFDWGAELLTHRALQEAAEVFNQGNRLFPKSVRMLVALGVTWYARGSNDEAVRYLGSASDLAPDNSTPYLFLGRMLSVETALPPRTIERLARFAQLQPDNALANYYYALGLAKQAALAADNDTERSARIESLLRKAMHFDPKLGAAYLQLGILDAHRGEDSRAISNYQKAIEAGEESGEPIEAAHYRLAQAYQRAGDKEKAQQELKLHAQLTKETKEQAVRERREIQEFVILLHNQNSASPPAP
jgi:tetratricopeptide (TPR) repeat protein